MASAGYLPAPNDIADAFSQYTVTAHVPYWDIRNARAGTRDVTVGFLLDAGVNGIQGTTNTDFLVRMEYLWQTVVAQWRAYNLTDSSTSITTPLYEGENVGFDTEIAYAVILVSQVGPGVDRWYMPSDFGKYGWFAWGSGVRLCPVNWVNFRSCQFIAPKPFNGWSVWLEPGCLGSITTFKREQPPQIKYDGKFEGFYPEIEDYLAEQWV